MIPRSEIIPSDMYNSYVAIIKENDFREAMRKNTKQFRKTLENIPRKKFDFAYAEGKWTIRQMLQHIIDAERVFAYRALRLSRKYGIQPPLERTPRRVQGRPGIHRIPFRIPDGRSAAFRRHR